MLCRFFVKKDLCLQKCDTETFLIVQYIFRAVYAIHHLDSSLHWQTRRCSKSGDDNLDGCSVSGPTGNSITHVSVRKYHVRPMDATRDLLPYSWRVHGSLPSTKQHWAGAWVGTAVGGDSEQHHQPHDVHQQPHHQHWVRKTIFDTKWNIFETKMMKYFWIQNDEIFLKPAWWNIFETNMMKNFWNQNDEIFLKTNEIFQVRGQGSSCHPVFGWR